MLISYNWLKNYVAINEPVEKVIDRIIHAGVEVANVRQLGKDITGVVIAELLSVEKHPKADRLSLTKVSTGTETFQVVCGAKNIAVGQRVPLAKVGAVLPGDFRIKEAKIRDVESFGMLCSAKELGLDEDAEGILILPPDAPLGADFLPYMGLPDTLFELEITPNRADLLSHIGIAREVGALFNLPVKLTDSPKAAESATTTASKIKVSIEAKDLCHLYTCLVIEGVKVGPSPKKLVQALEKIGQKSINNIVDVTNFVLHEVGQPLHAFDLSQIHGSQIIVRQARPGEKIPLLDKTERELKADMLVIADDDRPIALAGIMGGANSQVTENTTSILLESALFLPGTVRKTARQLGISTDSSYRFERGIDSQAVQAALQRAANLIVEVAGGQITKGVVSVATVEFKPVDVKFRPSRANAILGTNLSDKAQLQILKGLGCKFEAEVGDTLVVQCPSYRLDLTREIDLIEEVARLTGYDQIPTIAPKIPSDLSNIKSGAPFEKEIRFVLHQAGYFEAVNSTFLPNNFAKKLKYADNHPNSKFQEVDNPIADDQKVLRPTLLPSLLVNTQLNLAHQRESVGLYEINKVFSATGDENIVAERFQAAAVLAGQAPSAGWNQPARKTDFYDVKGLAENLLAECGITGAQWEYTGENPYLPTQSFMVKSSTGALLLWGGALNPKVLKEYEIAGPCFALEVELTALAAASHKAASYVPLPKFPEAWRDIALMVPDAVTSSQIISAVEEQGKPLLKQVELFDLYRGKNLPEGVRSLAYRLRFQADDKTLTDKDVSDKMTQITELLKERYSIALR
ncbi:MAG TPA: phenylalanine--tRNA ligase subunit beta [bacterium]|jgi:phenylalanyl-tRNA synthetase beta chain|nr:phenylalanine--tRNA ligase subunit beta [bacterium]